MSVTIVGDILWPAVFAYAVWRFANVAERWAPSLEAAEELQEVDVPSDLMALALTHSEAWAQEDTIKAMRERYAELKDWQKVRFAFGIGRIDG